MYRTVIILFTLTISIAPLSYLKTKANNAKPRRVFSKNHRHWIAMLLLCGSLMAATTVWIIGADSASGTAFLYHKQPKYNFAALPVPKTTSEGYTVMYDGNGNTGGTPPIDSHSPYTPTSWVGVLGAGDLVKAGYVFTGWNAAPDGGGTRYTPAQAFIINADTTLYARWSPLCDAAELDATFGAGGKVTTSFGAHNDVATSAAIQPDGKIVVAGYTSNDSNNDFALARYNVDGSLDVTFGGDGKVITNLGAYAYDDRANSVAIQPDGKIVVAGYTSNGSNNDFALVRYNADGSLDTTFDGDGKVTTSLGTYDDSTAASVAIQPDGKIVAAGTINWGSGIGHDFALARYNQDGSLDTTFDGDGKITTDFNSSDDYGTAVAIQPDGKTIVLGSSKPFAPMGRSVALARYNADGSFDKTFGGYGRVLASVSRDNYFSAVAIEPDGRIVAAGYGEHPNIGDCIGLLRLNPDGSLDPTFGVSGTVTTWVIKPTDIYRVDRGYAAAIQPSGKIVVAGQSYNHNTSTYEWTLVRYNADGSLDTTFDDDGIVTTTVSGKANAAYAVTIQADGKIVTAGYSGAESNTDFALVRYGAPCSTPSLYTVTYDGNGNTGGTVPVDQNAPYFLGATVEVLGPGNLVKTGYLFNGWNTAANGSGTHYDPADAFTITVNLTLYAQWVAPCDADELDLAFGSGGKVMINVTSDDRAYSVAIQQDGRIVIAGSSYDYKTSKDDFALVRLRSDGSLDTTFDGDGIVTTDFGNSDDFASSVAIQPDGKIVVAGSSQTSSNSDFALARYNPDGSLDTMFDLDGKVITNLGTYDYGYSVAIQGDGKIVVSGSSFTGSNNDFALVRYNPDGSLDSTFDGDGMVATDFRNSEDYASSVVIQPDGKIVAAGYSKTKPGLSDFALARYNLDGSLDTTFDGDGKVTTNLDHMSQRNGAAIQPDGKIVVCGSSHNGSNNDFALVRYNPDGSLDTTFDGDGKAINTFYPGGEEYAFSVAIQTDGRIVTAGVHGGHFALVRYNSDGSPDTTFGGDGEVITDLGSNNQTALSVTIQPDGKIIEAGYQSSSNGLSFALVRYGTACPAPTPTPTPTPSPVPVFVQFSSSTFEVTEGCVPATITVSLMNKQAAGTLTPSSSTVIVDYAITGGTASQKSDYTYVAGTVAQTNPVTAEKTIVGRLVFDPGETSQSIQLLINDDGFAEGPERVEFTLSNPQGAVPGSPATATLILNDNDLVDSPTNPIDDPQNFVCQQYHDFLHRQADEGGLAFWTGQITKCGTDVACIDWMRHNVAMAFFLSIEYQDTGYFVNRLYEACLNRHPSFEEFVVDMHRVGLGVEVGIGNWQQQLEDNKRTFAEEFVQRPEFLLRYPEGIPADYFVDEMFEYADVDPSSDERQEAIDAFGSGDTAGRAAAMSKIMESPSIFRSYYNQSFVRAEYFGYLRRNANDPPDNNWSGYDFWLEKMNKYSLPTEDVTQPSEAYERVKRGEMVRAFISSQEYRSRFGKP